MPKKSPSCPSQTRARAQKHETTRLIAEITVALRALRLPTMRGLLEDVTRQAEQGGWCRLRFLLSLLELEQTERERRRTEDRLRESKLPTDKTFSTYDLNWLPGSVCRDRIHALAQSTDWLDRGDNVLLFGGSGSGKSHLASAIGHEMVRSGRRVLSASTSQMAQDLMAAAAEARLPAFLKKLDRFDLLILEDFSYAHKDVSNTAPLFELISERYEHRSIVITANQTFSEWKHIFPDPAMTHAAVDRLVHRAVILNLGSESYRKQQAISRAEAGKPKSGK
ncbi:MAG: ATP-binding protein [Planctomycetes bacterium]|nr:ATP-binding protein [Planctomycetota bacterium]